MAFSCYVSGSFKLSWFGCSKLLLRPIEWSKATDLLYLIYCYAFSFTSSLLYDIESSHSYMVLLQNQPSCLPVSWADQYFMISICWAVAISYIFMVLLTTNEVDKNIPSNFFFKKSFRLNLLVGNIILSCNTFTFHSYWNLHDIYSLIWLMYAFFCLKHFYVPVGYKWDFKKLPCKLNLWLVIFVRLCGMRELYCLSPFGWLYRSTWHGEQVASPRDKEGYPGITINLKLTISGGA